MKVLNIASDYEVNSNSIQLNIKNPITLTFDFLQGGEVYVNNQSSGDVTIVGKVDLIEGEASYTLASGLVATFYHDTAEYRITPTSAQSSSNKSQLENITDNGAIDKRVVLTQAEYDALDPKDPTTEYIIVG